MARKRISIVESKVFSNAVRSHIAVSSDMEKYFNSYDFFSSYDSEIAAGESLLSIPVLSIVLPLAWITDADVYVDKLDKTFAKSMAALQNAFKKIYPKAPFKTNLVVDKVIENRDSKEGTALLFSGGLDATYSLFSNIARNPRLIMVLGTDIPLVNAGYLDLVKAEFSAFAERLGLPINYIRTNAFEILDRMRLDHLFWEYKERLEGDSWKGMGYALGHIGQVAPLSTGRFNRVLIAAWANKAIADAVTDFPDSSAPDLDEIIAWADLKVGHDGCLDRYDKALYMKDFLATYKNKLRVCWERPLQLQENPDLNCSRCEKCLRTMAALALAGVDPVQCGFRVDENTPQLMKNLFIEKNLTQKTIDFWWKPFRPIVPEPIQGELFGLKSFFEWLKNQDLDTMSMPFCPTFSLAGLYYKFPYDFSNLVRNILYRGLEKDARNHPVRKRFPNRSFPPLNELVSKLTGK